jgi:hypothetical protein
MDYRLQSCCQPWRIASEYPTDADQGGIDGLSNNWGHAWVLDISDYPRQCLGAGKGCRTAATPAYQESMSLNWTCSVGRPLK